MATADLYRNNLFRVLVVPVNAGPAEVRQRQKKIEMQRKLGISADNTNRGIFPLDPPPSVEDTTKALERMNDPLARFLDEFFWFSAPADDVGLAALERGSIAEARTYWKRQSAAQSSAVHSARNLAVLEHLLALESANPDGASAAASAAWKAVASNEAFWDHIRKRVEEMNDARLTTGFVRRLRETLPRMLLTVFARQAVAAAEQGNAKQTAKLLEVVRQSGFGSDVAEEVIRDVIKPIRSRISAAVASAKSRWAKAPQHGDRIVRELEQAVRPLLAIHDQIADSELARQGVHDEVAEAMNQAEIAYSKATNNWGGGEKLLAIALDLAIGQRLRDQIAENIKTNKKLAEDGNDWCAPGYWELAPDVVSELEKARAHAEAGNFDAALDILLVMDKRIGGPLKRAVAYSMSVKAIRATNQAVSAFNAESGVIKEIMDKLRAGDGRYRLPNPNMPSYALPPCLACGSSFYTRWTNFTFGGNQLFMCSSCSDRHDRTIQQEKRTLVAALSEPLQYLALAAKIDPEDSGIRKNKQAIEELFSRNGGSGTGDAKALEKQLTKQRVRRTPVPVVGTATETCFFCGQAPGHEFGAIAVPMHGSVTRTEFLLGSGVSYEFGGVIVPRCSGCRRHHADLPKRIEAWHEAALAAGATSKFPEARAAETDARETMEALAKGETLAAQAIERAQAAVARAIATQGFVSRLLRRPNPARDGANAALNAAQQQRTLAVGRKQQAEAAHKQAQAALWNLRVRAVEAYKAMNAQPELPEGIRPEEDFHQAPAVTGRQGKSWELGDHSKHEGGNEGEPKGLVSRAPVLREFKVEKEATGPKPPPLPKKMKK